MHIQRNQNYCTSLWYNLSKKSGPFYRYTRGIKIDRTASPYSSRKSLVLTRIDLQFRIEHVNYDIVRRISGYLVTTKQSYKVIFSIIAITMTAKDVYLL